MDIVFSNLTTDSTFTGMSASQIQVSNTQFIDINNSPHPLADAGPGQTVRTTVLTDYDFSIDATASAGDSTFMTMDFTVNGNTQSYTFGPFVVGSIANGQQFFPN